MFIQFVLTFVYLTWSVYHILVQWQKLFPERKYVRLAMVIGYSLFFNIIVIVAFCRLIFY